MRYRKPILWLSVAALAAASLLLGACDCNTPSEDDIGELVDEWYLSGDDTLEPRLGHLVDLVGALGDAGLTVEYPENMAYRFGWAGEEEEYWEWIARADANLAGYLHEVGPFYPGDGGAVLLTHAGLDVDSLAVEVEASKTWLENLIGTSVLSYAYPTHAHDRRAIEAVKTAGYIVARNGPISFEPWGSWLLGDADDPAWNQGWERTSPYELPLTFTAGEIQSLAVSEIEDWLADPANLQAWKNERRWVHLYTRTDSEDQTSLDILDQDHLEALVDALHEDGEVWVASMARSPPGLWPADRGPTLKTICSGGPIRRETRPGTATSAPSLSPPTTVSAAISPTILRCSPAGICPIRFS